MKKGVTQKIAFSAILSALGCVFLIIGGLFEVLDLTVAAIASLTVVISVIELSGKYPYIVYLVTAVLSLIIMPSSASVYYAAFLGFYPILKVQLEKLNPVIAWIVKLSAFNTCLTILFFFFQKIIGLPEIDKGYFVLLYFLCNIFFVVYDIALGRVILFYIYKMRKLLKMRDLF